MHARPKSVDEDEAYDRAWVKFVQRLNVRANHRVWTSAKCRVERIAEK